MWQSVRKRMFLVRSASVQKTPSGNALSANFSKNGCSRQVNVPYPS